MWASRPHLCCRHAQQHSWVCSADQHSSAPCWPTCWQSAEVVAVWQSADTGQSDLRLCISPPPALAATPTVACASSRACQRGLTCDNLLAVARDRPAAQKAGRKARTPQAAPGQRLKKVRLDVENGMVATQLQGAAIRALLANSAPLLRQRGPSTSHHGPTDTHLVRPPLIADPQICPFGGRKAVVTSFCWSLQEGCVAPCAAGEWQGALCH